MGRVNRTAQLTCDDFDSSTLNLKVLAAALWGPSPRTRPLITVWREGCRKHKQRNQI